MVVVVHCPLLITPHGTQDNLCRRLISDSTKIPRSQRLHWGLPVVPQPRVGPQQLLDGHPGVSSPHRGGIYNWLHHQTGQQRQETWSGWRSETRHRTNRAAENIRQPLNLHLDKCIHILKTKATACHIQSEFLPASTSSKANHSHRPLLPLATAAAAAREDIRLWDRDWTIPGSADVGLEEGLGLDVGGEKKTI